MKRTSVTILVLAAALLTLAVCLCACGEGGRDYTFESGSTALSIGASADSVQALGAPLSVNESASCGGIPGTDKVYAFSGFRVYTTPAESGDVICRIELTDDSVKTPEGLTIGSTAADVKAALGEGSRQGDSLIYTGASMKLTIVIRDDTVAGILYTVK